MTGRIPHTKMIRLQHQLFKQSSENRVKNLNKGVKQNKILLNLNVFFLNNWSLSYHAGSVSQINYLLFRFQ